MLITEIPMGEALKIAREHGALDPPRVASFIITWQRDEIDMLGRQLKNNCPELFRGTNGKTTLQIV
jgi:hypothetical protein